MDSTDTSIVPNKKDPRTHAVIGAAMEVHRILGPGHLEAVYQEALEIEFIERQIPFVAQPKIQIHYKIHVLKKFYVPDFLVYDAVVVELKAQSALSKADQAQILNSLRCTRNKVSLLINFGEVSLTWKRFVY